MKKIAIATLALAGSLAALAPAASIAQSAPPAAESGRGHAQMRQAMTPEQRIERRTERLRTQLQLQPGQEAALRAYAAALTPSAEQRTERQRMRGQMAQMTTPQRLDARKARMAERMAMFDRRAEATKRFYGQLTPTQQKAFDAMGQRGGDRGMPGRGGGHGGHGRHG